LQTFPWFNAWCGDIDLIGGKKPQSYYRDIVWNRTKMEMLVHAPVPAGHKEAVSAWGWYDEFPSFTFTGNEGKPLQVHVYTKYDVVRLFLNGQLVGEQKVSPQTNLTATFTIKYEPGVLKAIGVKNGKAVDSVRLQTAGKPARIRLVADRTHIKASRNDLSYITGEILDDKGQLVPDATLPLLFSMSGNGEITATGNANPSDMESFSAEPGQKKSQHKTFRGKCLIVVRPLGKPGKITVKAEAEDLTPGQVVIDTQ
jgi:beta-galactosidase